MKEEAQAIRIQPIEYMRGDLLEKGYDENVFYLSRIQPDIEEYFYAKDFKDVPVQAVKVFNLETQKVEMKKLYIVDLKWGYEFEGGFNETG